MRFFLIALSVVLTGCTTFSKTPEAFRAQHSKPYQFCSAVAPSTAFETLERSLRRCYDRRGETVHLGGVNSAVFDQWVESMPTDNGGSLTISIKEGYVLVTDVRAGTDAACQTQVQVYLLNGMWKRHATWQEKALLGEPACPL